MEIMNEEYPEELVNCQNCNYVKKNTTLLDCFHNICRDCQQENEYITCQSCPQNHQIPREGIKHQLNALIYEYLTNHEPIDPDTKRCTMCGKLEDTVYCTDCGTFWCELGIEELHNNIITRGNRHVMKKEVTKFDFRLMPKGEGDQDDEAEWGEMLGRLGSMEEAGREHQIQLMQERNSLEEWKIEQEDEIGGLFDRIIERLVEGKKKFIRDLNIKCETMQERLEENMNRNEMKLTTLKRGFGLATKMKFHNLSSEPMREFLTDRQILQNIGTTQLEKIRTHVNKDDLSEVDKLNLSASVSVHVPYLPNCHIIHLQESGKVDNPVNMKLCLKDEENEIIKGSVNSSLACVQITMGGSENEPFCQSIFYDDPHYTAQFFPCKAGKYEAKLKINGKVCKTCKPHSTQITDSLTHLITPVFASISDQGLHRAITASADNLYCVVKEPPEIRRYHVKKPTPHDEISPEAASPGRKEVLSLETNFGEGQLGSPCGICYLDAHLYVVDAGFNCVHIFTNNGEYIEKFGNTGSKLGQFQRPMGIDYDYLRKEILIADTFNNRIQSCSNTREFNSFGTNEHFKLKDPVDVKACKNGFTVVTTLGAKILLYDLARNFSQVIICGILTPRHCCIDSDDNIYVTSHLGHSVYKIVRTERGENGFEKIKLKTDQEFRFPTGVTTNSDGKLFVISRELNPESSKSFINVW